MTPVSPRTILKQTFGFDEFRPLQEQVITNILARRDTLVIMQTGGGKSLCYQLPALVFNGLTVVVSPLIALMKDQVEQLQALGVAALFLNSSLSWEEYRANQEFVRSGKIKLLYVAPETLLMERTLDLLANVKLDLLAIDEAHCISEWGHDFRPEYRQLVEVRKRFPAVVFVALTATATQRVREDIRDTLGFSASNEFIASFDRNNLLLEVASKADPLLQTLQLIERYPGQSGIIYCFSRRQVEDLAAALVVRHYLARPYHAGLTDEERKANQDAFIRDDIQIMVATIAFGMGINKSNVRFVIHYDLPKNIEGYYQEIGRAGRDGLPAHCLLLFGYGDIQKQRHFIEQKEGKERQIAYQHLSALIRYAESETCRRGPLLAYFGEIYPLEKCGMCDNCLGERKENVDVTIPAQKFLSCILRSGERFGAAYIIDLLLGEETQKVRTHQHQGLSTFGIGKELSRAEWQHLGRQLVQKGLLTQEDRFGSLSLTEPGKQALLKREKITAAAYEAKGSVKPVGRAGDQEYDRAIFELLRAKRKELADKVRVPPYVIFSDKTLAEMATYFPHSPNSLLRINGVGQAKLANYGEAFLAVIRSACQERGLTEKLKPAGEKRTETRSQARTPRKVEVARAFNQGKTAPELASLFGVQIETILEHLANYALEGNRLRTGNDLLELAPLSAQVYEAVFEAFRSEGLQFLKPVYDRLNGAVVYEKLRILRVHYLMNLNL